MLSAVILILSMISIHALHEESDTAYYGVDNMRLLFQSTLSMRRATQVAGLQTKQRLFQSTLSMRRATWRSTGKGPPYLFQSTLSMRRATNALGAGIRQEPISIHALHEESDVAALLLRLLRDGISIHALHEESDATPIASWNAVAYFNPRSP